MGTSLARPLIAEEVVRIAHKERHTRLPTGAQVKEMISSGSTLSSVARDLKLLHRYVN